MSKAFTKEDEDGDTNLPPRVELPFVAGPFHVTPQGLLLMGQSADKRARARAVGACAGSVGRVTAGSALLRAMRVVALVFGAGLAVGCTSTTPAYGAPYVPEDAGVDARDGAAAEDSSGSLPSCTRNGEVYSPGEHYPSDDGCNACVCNPNGEDPCTAKRCPTTCSYNGMTLNVGESFAAPDGCNTCSCVTGGKIVCTKLSCAP
jgi:hypothetical protein